MAESRKSQANRANAQASTGPRTGLGKSRSARNARRHGLTVPACSDPTWSAEILELAQHLVGPSADCELLESARRFAAAQIDVWRVQRARHLLLLRGLSRNDYYPKSIGEFRRTITLMKEALRLEAKLGFPVPMHIPIPHPAKGARKFARVIADLSRLLATMDRYDRRARSRRRQALREFDAALRRIDARIADSVTA